MGAHGTTDFTKKSFRNNGLELKLTSPWPIRVRGRPYPLYSPPMTKLAMTKAAIDALPTPTKTTMYWDDHQPHLALKVRPTGRKVWMVYRSVKGRPVKKTIGPWPSFTVAVAREKARQLIVQQDVGEAPRQTKATLAEVAELYTQHLVSQGRRRPDYVTTAMNTSWPALKNRKLDSVGVVEISEEHARIVTTRGRVAGARAVKVLRTIFAYAMDMELCIRNPAKRVRVEDSKPRSTFLNVDELQVFQRALATMPAQSQDYFNLLLLTGQRKGNVESMKWADINLEKGEWTIPAEDFKTGVSITVPLVPEALAILRQRRDHSPTWVFPSPKAKCGHLTESYYWKKELQNKMVELGVTKTWTTHDLRRTHASILTAQGVPLTTVAKSLGHANITQTQTYARSDVAGVRAAVSAAAGALLGTGGAATAGVGAG